MECIFIYVSAIQSKNYVVITERTKMVHDANLTCGVFWALLVLFARGDFYKKRLCIQYEIDDYKSSKIPLKKLSAVTQSVCFMECVRHQKGSSPCRAFHFSLADSICELLPKGINECMADKTTPGITYVHLSDCEFVAPWRGIKHTSGALQWITKRGQALALRSPGGGRRYVMRILNKGLWLLGYAYRRGIAFANGFDGARIACRSNIQYINSSKPVKYRWVSFSRGDPVPPGAIVGGYWPNGTPLYIIYVDASALFPGYYNAESLQVQPISKYKPGSLNILVSRK